MEEVVKSGLTVYIYFWGGGRPEAWGNFKTMSLFLKVVILGLMLVGEPKTDRLLRLIK